MVAHHTFTENSLPPSDRLHPVRSEHGKSANIMSYTRALTSDRELNCVSEFIKGGEKKWEEGMKMKSWDEKDTYEIVTPLYLY